MFFKIVLPTDQKLQVKLPSKDIIQGFKKNAQIQNQQNHQQKIKTKQIPKANQPKFQIPEVTSQNCQIIRLYKKKELIIKIQKQTVSYIMQESKHRIAIVNGQRCKPKKCQLQCKKSCPVNRTGKLCIDVQHSYVISEISEILCIGCGLCVKQCPFKAIQIVNIPKNMQKLCTHRYGKNSFKLHRLPIPRPGQVLGLVGINGIGKTTALQILGNLLQPNLGNFTNPPSKKQIIKHFKGSELQNYFKKMNQQKFISVTKPQYIDIIPTKLSGTVNDILSKKDQTKTSDYLKHQLQLSQLSNRNISQLSGGQLQRLAIMIVMLKQANIYIFDEPTSYLDIKQRIKIAKLIRQIQTLQNYIIVVQHDLSILDYLSDFICCLYGQPAAYGVVSMPSTVREGINIFLSGFIPSENMRFREEELTFKISDHIEQIKQQKIGWYEYPRMVKKINDFTLTVQSGKFKTSQITVLLGQNGTGKTTFIKMLNEYCKQKQKQQQSQYQLPKMSISYKPQSISFPKFNGTVRQLFNTKVNLAWLAPTFITQVTKPLHLDTLLDHEVKQLSGGEIQRVAIILALAKSAQFYLIDQPSAFLDSQQRVICARVLKRFMLNNHKIAFIVQHDFIMSTYLADQVIVYQGEPGINCKANSPQGLVDGMNKFLSMLQITFRKDPYNFRPRINKLNSVLDKQQKTNGNFFCIEE